MGCEDGIIEWIVNQNGSMPETFVGIRFFRLPRVEHTRFLLCNRNWRGLVIDGNPKNIDILKNDNISWRYDFNVDCELHNCREYKFSYSKEWPDWVK